MFAFAIVLSQEEEQEVNSNIQHYIPSKLIGKGQIDLKWFNSLYTKTKSTFNDGKYPSRTFLHQP